MTKVAKPYFATFVRKIFIRSWIYLIKERLGTKKGEEKKDDDDFEEAKHWAMNQKQSLARNKPASN